MQSSKETRELSQEFKIRGIKGHDYPLLTQVLCQCHPWCTKVNWV